MTSFNELRLLSPCTKHSADELETTTDLILWDLIRCGVVKTDELTNRRSAKKVRDTIFSTQFTHLPFSNLLVAHASEIFPKALVGHSVYYRVQNKVNRHHLNL